MAVCSWKLLIQSFLLAFLHPVSLRVTGYKDRLLILLLEVAVCTSGTSGSLLLVLTSWSSFQRKEVRTRSARIVKVRGHHSQER
jgi:hypothetical protein